ncbi:MAG: hypothetical protein U5N56_09155 [Candidatus Marinimicrobia bacterium]|nr:hypothetical protein [Candidatus Neomarinimicrobiota bacterium]
MRALTQILMIPLSLLLLSSCIFTGTGDGLDAGSAEGLYITVTQDPHSSIENPPYGHFYVQLWDDGSGEGGFWEDPLTESDFFTWELEDDTIRFTSDFYLFDSTVYYIEEQDSGGFILIADGNDFDPISFYKSRQDTVSRVEYTTQDIAGTWRNTQAVDYVFGADGSLQVGDYSPTTWERGEITYTIENGWGGEWAVRMYNGHMVIMAGYK